MPCCPAVIDLWKDCENLHFPEVSDQWFQTESDRNSAALDGSSDDVSDALLFQLRSKLIALMQRSKTMRLAGPDRLRIDDKLPALDARLTRLRVGV